MQTSVTLFSTEGCHLCEQAKEMVEKIAPHISMTVKDIAYDDELYEQYRYHIPVLKTASGAELNWPFEPATLKEFLS
ncbi:glutaredoxin family protein [Lacimicrobium sp. SS2-24]|uniref:glutaredoxin family protein n=1 Tax=Lacimicrobium sp. SS2-24 TaxID=2005569 RepID=UPI000B4B1DDB|nr:glutaredoxin family protein [Lacimicrobium sp. SS2-24]